MSITKRTFAVVSLSGCLLAAGIAMAQGDNATPTPTPSRPVVAQPTIVDFLYPLCRGECRQERATDVFVGRVVSRVPGTPVVAPAFEAPLARLPFPTTLYTVEVFRAIRGNAAGRVIVYQSGVLNDVSLDSLGDEPPLLAPGEIAVFVAVWDDEWRWFSLIDGRLGHHRLPNGVAGATAVAEFIADFGTPTPSPLSGANGGPL